MTTRNSPLYETTHKLRAGTLDLLDYITQTCSWLDEVEPQIRALIPEENRMQRLMRQAEHLLSMYPEPESRPPLFGALIGVKDIYIADGFPMRAGSKLPPEEFEGQQASSVTNLVTAGALILGKTVTTEFAYFAPGPTRNPHNPDYTPGGSSSGSAAAVAAGMCTLSLGTQTIGSVIRPGAYCGLYGFKPTFEKIEIDGVLPCSQTVDHIGYFTQDIDGIILAASVLIPDWRGLPDKPVTPLLGIPVGPYLEQAEGKILASFWKSVDTLIEADIQVKHIPMFDDIETINIMHRKIVAAEFSQNHARLYERYGHLYAPQSRELLEQGLAISDSELLAAIEMQKEVLATVSETMIAEEINLWVCPASLTTAPLGLASTGSPTMNLPWTNAGVPALSVPAGVGENNLPSSIQLVADYGCDEALLAMAKIVSRAFMTP